VRESGADYGAGRGDIAIYRAPDGTISLDVRLEHETLWLTQEQMAKVFDVKRPAVTKHLATFLQHAGTGRGKHMFHCGTHGPGASARIRHPVLQS
jgi:hypothetical protein